MSHIWMSPLPVLGRRARCLSCLVWSVLAVAFGAMWFSSPALGLPEGRVYELVSPPYKGGYGATYIDAVAPNGESVAFYSPGAFGASPSGFTTFDYVARRGASEWSTLPEMQPASVMPAYQYRDVSSTLETMLALGELGPSDEAAILASNEVEFVVHPTDSLDTKADWTQAGPVLKPLRKAKQLSGQYEGASADLCHLLVTPAFADISEFSPLLPEPGLTGNHTLYEVNRGCGSEPASLRFVAVDNKGKVISPSCEQEVGGGTGGEGGSGGQQESSFNAVSEGGGEVFFMTSVEDPGCGLGLSPACGEVPCAGAAERPRAEFLGASRDGSRVFFRTTAPLTGEGEGDELYMARIGCPSGEGEACEPAETQNMSVTELVRVSRDPNVGEAAEVRGVVRIAPDGSRVYFVAGGVLSEGPARGADNLYVYEPDPEHEGRYRTVFVADLCSGPGLSGSVEDLHCPADLNEGKKGGRNDLELWGGYETSGNSSSSWGGGSVSDQTAGVDGRFLVFSTYAQLSAGDTDSAVDVYRYDAQSGLLERVSIGEDGYDANGNGAFDAHIKLASSATAQVAEEYEMGTRAVSENGSRIVFTTAEPLSPDAVNGLVNAYEWHEEPGWSEGRVSLVSSGNSQQPVEDVVISPSGGDVFFVTSQGLVPQDNDGAPDVYDARLDGGFAPAPAPVRECSADACQGPLTNPAPLLVPGSVVQEPGESLPMPEVATAKPKTKSKVKSKVKPKRRRRSSKRRGKAKRSSVRSGR
jgi:hypothetical protein